MTTTHPHDLTKALCALVKDGFLESDGATRGTFYFFPGEPPDIGTEFEGQPYGLMKKTIPEELFSAFHLESTSSDHLEASSDHLETSSDHLETSSDHLESLKAIADLVRCKGKVSNEVMEQTILQLCQGRFLTHRELGKLLNRAPDSLRSRFLSKMVKRGQLELRYPDKPTHENQAYRVNNQL